MKNLFILILSLPFSLFSQTVDSNLVRSHLDYVVKECPNRYFGNISSLNKCSEYIFNEFNKYGDSTVYQNFEVDGLVYRNVITSFGPSNGERIIVGAHYDVCGDQDGADDNASGTVGLLELARLLKEADLNKRIDLVAYSLEEPPYFRSEYMGSYVHARYLVDQGIPVYGMVCLEMIGYFNDERNSQHYPLKILKLIYGGKGNYITLVKRTGSGKMPRKFKRKFKRNKQLKTKSFTGPSKLTGIDFSDHLNYWALDIEAVMITNTGFFRNKNYHQKTDKIETLDINRMCGVIQQTYNTLLKMSN
ncbi:MAG: M28 family peptidase [Crocinitomicaceae bacterium]